MIEAENGAHAVAIVKRDLLRVNAICMDRDMPVRHAVILLPVIVSFSCVRSRLSYLVHDVQVMNGCEATRELRSLGYHGVVVGVTGNVLESDIQAFVAHGADAVVTKPVNVAALIGILTSKLKYVAH